VDPDDRRVNRLTATVDLTVAPWSALTRFDDAFHQATAEVDPDLIEQFATALDQYTNAAAAASAPQPGP
jgi:hypothetical protein